ncbi:hypothetical protein AVEN_197292-1 [Araneus ventricosus]|uniref:Mos1 transposase HTH domain-containing protein n=1 Tax=Araneus ventricosus TaxID=182803 RepID=A0A4Y2PAM3_ARAVE|nr:hypothetical protein AVEN_197292-1 [Araneus ventricosus]
MKWRPYLYRRCIKSQWVNVLADRWSGGIPSCTCVTATHQYPHFWKVVSAVRCMMDSSRSAQRAVIQFLRAEGEHASQIYRRMKEVCGEKCLARCTIFRWCQAL